MNIIKKIVTFVIAKINAIECGKKHTLGSE